ncbi:MAG TPA: nicotinate (nicotinamide) nucleotide adenylyltransferase [Victivallales bacterium]|nr:nicotinate (nicotinamide) nucleotide adenylyltransferase [Victivallales bacterium]
MTKKAFFGGTFDPPHNAHISIAASVLSAGLADEIIFVPAFAPPHKTGHPSASFEDRLKMTKLATEGEPRFSVSDIEGRMRKTPSFTHDTMTEIQSLYPKDQIMLLIGSDSLLYLHTWHMAKEIVRKWKILTYPRPGFEISISDLEKFWPSNIANNLLRGVLKELALSNLASSQIRYNINAKGTSQESLSPKVADYIKKKGLYKKINKGASDA